MRAASWLVVVAVGLAAFGVGSAAARRAPTPQERSDIAADIGVPAECSNIRVSTVNSSWASFTSPYSTGCAIGDGFAILRHEPQGWVRVWENTVDDFGACPGVPDRVAVDLGYCRAARTYILCDRSRGHVGPRVPIVKPSRCDTLGPQSSFGDSANLVGLRWARWGAAVAYGRGFERGYHLPLEHIPVTIKAYGRRQSRNTCEGDFVYTRLRLHSRYGTLIVRFPASSCP